MEFARLIRAARRRVGLSQDELARTIRVRRNAVSQLEHGIGTLKTLIPIMEVLRIAITGLPPGPDLGSRVKAARHKRDWSLIELSARSGVSIPTIRGLEQNRGRIASLEAVIKALAPTARDKKSRKVLRTGTTQRWPAPTVQSLIHGDCMHVMPTLAWGSVDLVVTSPPYNADREYEGRLSLDEYKDFTEQWLACAMKTLSDTGALWINLGYLKTSEATTLPLPYLYFPIAEKLGFHFVQEVVWHYEGGMTYGKRFTHRTERWMWFVKDPTNYIFHLDDVRDGTLNRTINDRNHELGKNPTDYWYFDRVVGGRGATREKTLHPAQFPVDMVERIVRACSNPGDLVLDPFGGSGSTAEAAYRNGRSFISIEKETRYHDVAQRRLAAIMKTGSRATASNLR